MNSLYLYHATGKENLDSIKKNGLLINPPSHTETDDPYREGKIFLAFDAQAACDYAEVSEQFDEVAVLKVKLENLDPYAFGYDENNLCDSLDMINSCIYMKDIPAEALQECSPDKEPELDFNDFEGTAVFEIVSDAFYTNNEVYKEDDER